MFWSLPSHSILEVVGITDKVTKLAIPVEQTRFSPPTVFTPQMNPFPLHLVQVSMTKYPKAGILFL